MIDPERLANLDQVATAVVSVVADGAATGARAVDIHVWGGIDLRLLPDRGLDIGGPGSAARPLAWISQAGEQGRRRPESLVDDVAWGAAWGGGLVTTCGLSNVGRGSEGQGLHGTYTSRPAVDLHVERTTADVTATATVDDPPFRLARRVVTTATEGLGAGSTTARGQRLRVDRRRTASLPRQHRFRRCGTAMPTSRPTRTRSSRATTTRRPASPPGMRRRSPAGGCAGAGLRARRRLPWARLTSPRLRIELTVQSSLPRLWQWVHPQPAPTRSRSSRQTVPCSAARTTSRRAGCPSSTRVRRRTSWLTIEARPV